MYESFFNLKLKPFELVPNPQFLFMSGTHRRAMNYLQYGFEERAGFILLTGSIGSGKTTLVRELTKRLADKAVIAKVFNTQIDPSQLLGLINMDFGLNVTTLDKVTLLKDLNEFLIGCYSRKEKPLLIIDEAQNLTVETLEEIRLLSNLESESEKLLQIILVGQPELQKIIIHQDSLAQLRQRLSVSCHLGTLTLDETREYFCHRLQCAGNQTAITVPDEAFNHIHKACNGVPRLINILGDYLLLAAFSDQIKELPIEFIEEVIGEIKSSVAFYNQFNPLAEEVDVAGTSVHQEVSSDTEQGGLATVQDIWEKQQKHEVILKNIIRKQVMQIDTIQDQLDVIGSSVHVIELALKALSKNDSVVQKEELDALKKIDSKLN
jgi:putative secretion ATPase (PEP-CTERM system associated)